MQTFLKLKRTSLRYLNEWKHKKNRKPLILRGARQVGKTTLVIDFSQAYKHCILLNLEKRADIAFFNATDDVNKLIESLFLSRNIGITDLKDTLLFIDEIQESPAAIQMLRYFYEELPQLHVIAAGSLLEFALKDVRSFPVGRVEYHYLHPLSFEEFLLSANHTTGHEQLITLPVNEFAHQTLLDLFHQYVIIGGMPEVVKTYLESNTITTLPPIYESIWRTYRDDIEKYGSSPSEKRVIKHIMTIAHLYVDERVKFQDFGKSNYKSREVSEALRTLTDAKVIRLIYPTTNTKAPIQPDLKKSPRLQFLDTGLVNHSLNIQASMISMGDLSNSYKGAIIPHIVTQELISTRAFTDLLPNFWVRDKTQSSAEVDLTISHQEKIIPIEIKSGKVGKLRSLHQFMEECDHPYAIRLYAGKFQVKETQTPKGKRFLLMDLPYYAGTQLERYIGYFIGNYSLSPNNTTHDPKDKNKQAE